MLGTLIGLFAPGLAAAIQLFGERTIAWFALTTLIAVGLVLPFDRLLDMTRTVPSVSANLTVATLVARAEGALDDRAYRAGRMVE